MPSAIPIASASPISASGTATRSRSRRFLLTHPASSVEARFALAAMVGFAALFVALLPFVRMPLSEVSAFIPTYDTSWSITAPMAALRRWQASWAARTAKSI